MSIWPYLELGQSTAQAVSEISLGLTDAAFYNEGLVYNFNEHLFQTQPIDVAVAESAVS
jgi:hypothetical protein